MWKTVIYTTFYILWLDFVGCATFILPEQPKPEKENENGCYMPERDKVLAYNETYSPQDNKTCIQYTCNEDGSTSGATCGVQLILEPCTRVPGDKSLPYPQCCDGVSCPKPPVDEDPPVQMTFPKEPTDTADIDNSTDPDPPVGPTRPCPTCPYPPVNLNSVEEPVASTIVDPEPELEPSDPIIIPANSPKAPMRKLSCWKNSCRSPVATVSDGPSNPLPIIIPPKRPPTDPVCVYPTDLSESTTASKKIPPHCPPRDSPRESVPVVSLQSESSNSSIYHGPRYTNPVEPPVTSVS